ncbi:MAG TPA: ABC-type transport auxiliary lipoprotein family protein [Burkholderiaceae bacterium]|jgi:hypothetical protein
MKINARPLLNIALLGAALALTACAGSSAPPPQFYQLRLDPPVAVNKPSAASTEVWQIMSPIHVPEYLERDVLWLPTGSAGLQPLPDQRWAEPLADAIPRVLLHDLGVLRGTDHLWGGAVPTGVVIAYQLRIDVQDMSVTEGRNAVHLRARCAASDPRGQMPTRVIEIDVTAPSSGSSPDALVAAHRLALWSMAQQLSERLSAAAPNPR